MQMINTKLNHRLTFREGLVCRVLLLHVARINLE